MQRDLGLRRREIVNVILGESQREIDLGQWDTFVRSGRTPRDTMCSRLGRGEINMHATARDLRPEVACVPFFLGPYILGQREAAPTPGRPLDPV